MTLGIFGRHKAAGRKLVVLTAYDLSGALVAAAGGVDAILVGDSLGMVVLGYPNTLPVTMQEMSHHCAAVMRARPQVPVIADLPYGSFHVSPQETVRDVLQLVKRTGVNAVKVEGGRRRGPVISALLDAEIPVMGHLGLTPQSINRLGGYKVQGRGPAAAEELAADAAFLAACGCFALVLECVPAGLARRISADLPIPTIGIGAGAGCDGQVLVYHDLLGLLSGPRPRFVKRYADLGSQAIAAVAAYAAEVRSGTFPALEHTYPDDAGAVDEEQGSPLAGAAAEAPGPYPDPANGPGD